MTDREHLLALRSDIGTIMAVLSGLLLDTTNVRAMVDGGQGRATAQRLYERAQQIIAEVTSP